MNQDSEDTLTDIERLAKEIAEEEIKECPLCHSKNLVYGEGMGLSKMKPYVSCADCKELLAWG